MNPRCSQEQVLCAGVRPAHSSERITLEHTFPLPRKTRPGPRATKSTREKPRKSKPKPTPEKPLTLRPQRPKPPKKDRQEYDKTRSQTPERRAYKRRYAQQKRERQESLGLCRDCSNPAIPGESPGPQLGRQLQQHIHPHDDWKVRGNQPASPSASSKGVPEIESTQRSPNTSDHIYPPGRRPRPDRKRRREPNHGRTTPPTLMSVLEMTTSKTPSSNSAGDRTVTRATAHSAARSARGPR